MFKPDKTSLPEPALVIPNAPETVPFSAKVFAVIVKVRVAFKAISPVFCVRL